MTNVHKSAEGWVRFNDRVEQSKATRRALRQDRDQQVATPKKKMRRVVVGHNGRTT